VVKAGGFQFNVKSVSVLRLLTCYKENARLSVVIERRMLRGLWVVIFLKCLEVSLETCVELQMVPSPVAVKLHLFQMPLDIYTVKSFWKPSQIEHV